MRGVSERVVKDVWDSGAGYESFIGRWSWPVTGKFLRWLSVPAGANWLDVGCGTGILTQTILDLAAPGAEVRVNYGMPYYSFRGRLAYFRLWKKHIGLYIPTPVIDEHRRALRGYEASRATVRFPLDRKLPAALMRKLIRARLKKNEAGGQ